MVSLRSGAVLKEANKQGAKAAKPRKAPISKKRKAEEELPKEKEKENLTPEPPIEQEESKNNATIATPPKSAEREKSRTPGRVGPIKEGDFSLEPNIKPFKGPKGNKVRKSFAEKQEEYAQFCRDNEGHPFHELYICYDKGPDGSPTYDKSGFELDYDKVAGWMGPKAYNKNAMVNGMGRAVSRAEDERKQMAEIFFEKGEAPDTSGYISTEGMWKDRVSKDLNVPWHKIGVEHFREWEKRGFKKARKGEYATVPEGERKRMTRLLSGASLRK